MFGSVVETCWLMLPISPLGRFMFLWKIKKINRYYDLFLKNFQANFSLSDYRLKVYDTLYTYYTNSM